MRFLLPSLLLGIWASLHKATVPQVLILMWFLSPSLVLGMFKEQFQSSLFFHLFVVD